MEKIITIERRLEFKHQVSDLQYKEECKLHFHDCIVKLSMSDNYISDKSMKIDWSEKVLITILDNILNPINGKQIIDHLDNCKNCKDKYKIQYQLITHMNILQDIYHRILKQSTNCYFKISLLLLNTNIKYTISNR